MLRSILLKQRLHYPARLGPFGSRYSSKEKLENSGMILARHLIRNSSMRRFRGFTFGGAFKYSAASIKHWKPTLSEPIHLTTMVWLHMVTVLSPPWYSKHCPCKC